MPEYISWAEVIGRAIENRLLELHTAMPGRVIRYDAATQLAEVQPQVRIPTYDVEGRVVYEELPVIPDVPVCFPSTAGAFLSFPIEPGHFVLLLFCESSIDAWRGTGSLSDAGDERRHNLTHAIALAGLAPRAQAFVEASATDIVLGFDGGSQVLVEPGDPGAVVIGRKAATDHLISAESLIDALKTPGSIDTATGGPGVLSAAGEAAILAAVSRHRID